MNRARIRSVLLAGLVVAAVLGSSANAAEQPEDKLTGDLRRAWELLNTGDHAGAVRFVDSASVTVGDAAKDQAQKMRGFASAGQQLNFHPVNIAGTLCYVRALAFQRSGKRDEWLGALRRTWTEFPFCQAWDPKGWWWKPAQAAKKEWYEETIKKAVRDRSLQSSPFPDLEDALDAPQMTIALGSVVGQLFEQGDYPALEYLAGRLRDLPMRLPDGAWALRFFYPACVAPSGPEAEEGSWERTRDRIAAWQKAVPESATAPVAEAIRLIRHAWHIRGGGYASTVKPEVWPVFEKRIEAAKGVLEKSPRTCPEWYPARLTVARAQGDTREHEIAIFDEGWKSHPGYTPLLDEIITDLLPRWSGQPGDWHKMAKRVAKMGEAKVYTLATNLAWGYERAGILEAPGFDRALYRKGWKELLDEHPGSLSLAHQCLAIARSLGDVPLTNEAFQRTGKRYHPSFWTSPEQYQIARQAAGVSVGGD